MPLLPLFPLGTVLAPGGTLPLQVFEPRYLRLLADLLGEHAAGEPELGVVAIRHGHEVGDDRLPQLHEVGTVARIVRAAALDDGRWMIVGVGGRRFRLEGIVDAAGTPYLTGEVTWLDEPDGDEPLAGLAARVRAEATAYLHRTGACAELPAAATALSHAVGAATGLPLGDRQLLLAAPDTTTRLRLALRLLRREGEVLARFGAVPGTPSAPMSPN